MQDEEKIWHPEVMGPGIEETLQELQQRTLMRRFYLAGGRTNLMQKLKLHNTAEIVLCAVRKKIHFVKSGTSHPRTSFPACRISRRRITPWSAPAGQLSPNQDQLEGEATPA